MNVLGGAFAEFGFQDEAASGRDLLAGLQSVTNFHAIFVALAQRNRVRLEAVRRANENRRRVFDGLDRLDWNRDRNTTSVGANSDRHERPGRQAPSGLARVTRAVAARVCSPSRLPTWATFPLFARLARRQQLRLLGRRLRASNHGQVR